MTSVTTDLEIVAQRLDAVKTCSATDFHTHFSEALRNFRFVPSEERRAIANDFCRWTERAATAGPCARSYAAFMQAMDRFISEDYGASLELLTQARADFIVRHDREGLGLCSMLVGAVYRTFGNFDLALQVLWESYELLKASGQYPIFLAATANSLANIHFDMGDLDDAYSMFEVVHAESARANDFYFGIYGLLGLGRVLMTQEKTAEAADVFERALALAEESKTPVHVANSLTELATLYFRSGNLENAESLSERALSIRERHHMLGGAVTNCLRIAEIRRRQGRWTDAQPVLARALAFADELRVKPKMAQVQLQLSHFYEQIGDLEKSLEHHKRFHALREEVEREDSVRQLADAKAIFQAEQTKKENAIIRRQKMEIEHKNVQLQDTIDELTRAKIGRKAKALTLGLAIVLFIFQDAILGTALRLLPSHNYFVLLAVKMAIIFSLAPINRGIEHHLLKKVIQRRRLQSSIS